MTVALLVGKRAGGMQNLANASNLAARTYLEEATANAREFELRLTEEGVDPQVLAGREVPAGTLVSIGIGCLHIQDLHKRNRLGDGVHYPVDVDLSPLSNELDFVRIQIQPLRRGIFEGNLTINAFHSQQLCQGAHIQLSWGRLNQGLSNCGFCAGSLAASSQQESC